MKRSAVIVISVWMLLIAFASSLAFADVPAGRDISGAVAELERSFLSVEAPRAKQAGSGNQACAADVRAALGISKNIDVKGSDLACVQPVFAVAIYDLEVSNLVGRIKAVDWDKAAAALEADSPSRLAAVKPGGQVTIGSKSYIVEETAKGISVGYLVRERLASLIIGQSSGAFITPEGFVARVVRYAKAPNTTNAEVR